MLLTDGGDPLEVDLASVRLLGAPQVPFAFKPMAERSLRIGLGDEAIIVCFTGEVTGDSGSLTDLQVGRLSGDMDPLTVVNGLRDLWRPWWR